MSDVQKCDGCGDIRFRHNTTYNLGTAIADVEVSPDAVDVTKEGHLCDDCATEVAELIKGLGND